MCLADGLSRPQEEEEEKNHFSVVSAKFFVELNRSVRFPEQRQQQRQKPRHRAFYAIVMPERFRLFCPQEGKGKENPFFCSQPQVFFRLDQKRAISLMQRQQQRQFQRHKAFCAIVMPKWFRLFCPQ